MAETLISDPITTTFSDLVAEKSLTEGSTYMLQNVGNQNIVLRESATAPAAGAKGHIIKPLCWWPFTVDTGGRLDVRVVQEGQQSFAAITEATFS